MKNWRYPGGLLVVFLIFWAALAINPVSRSDWLLENLLTVTALTLFVLTRNKLRFSSAAYTCLFVFFCLHTVGAHYTYSEVPYDDWWASLTGQTLNSMLGLERNHYDRLVHFLYGALMLLPSCELFAAFARPRGVWRYILPVTFVMAHSVIYELIEWIAALTAAPELGQAYLGTQGDVWDAQQDMALAMFGSILAMIIVRLSPRWRSLAA